MPSKQKARTPQNAAAGLDPKATGYSMKYFNFLIYFLLFAVVLGCLFAGAQRIWQAFDTNNNAHYAVYPFMRGADILVGALLLTVGGMAIHVRWRLNGRYKEGPFWAKVLPAAAMIAVAADAVCYLIGYKEALAQSHNYTYVICCVCLIVLLGVLGWLNGSYLDKRRPVFSRVDPKRSRRWTRDDTELTILALPTTIWYILFCYLPMFGIILAFKNYKIIDATQSFLSNLLASDWVGFDNFLYFITLRDFPMLIRNTLLYNVVFIILGIVLPVGLAIMINNIYSKRKSKTYQTMMFMPHFMSWVVIGYFVYAFLSLDKGFMNSILKWFGADPINWYATAKYWPYILVFMQVWKTLGYNMVVYLASISGIDQSLYEAAVLDGASKMQQARYITLPSLKPIIIMMFILAVGRIFSTDFGLFWQLTRYVPKSLANVATTFDVRIYQMLTTGNTPLGRTAAASLFQSAIGCLTILGANWIVRKVDKSSALI